MLGHVDGGAKNKGGGSKTVHYRQRQQQKKSTHKQQQQQQQKLSHTQQQKQAKSTHHQPQPPPPPQQQQQQDTHRHQQTHQPHPARGPRAADLSRAALVCENWYAITDQRLPSIRTNVDGGIFLLGPSGIDYAPMGDHSAAGLASATSSLEGSHIMPSRLAFENKVADDNREHTVKQLLIDFEAGKIDEDEFEQQKYQLKVRQLTRLRQQLGKGLISPAAYNLEAARIIDEHKTGPFDAEVRINFFGTQRELSELVDKLKEVLASDRPRASEENQKNDAPNSAKCPPKAVVEIVKSRFAVRSGVGAALFARDNNGLDNPDDPELMRRREQELLEAAERKVAEKQAAELAKRRAQATKWLLSDLGAHSTVPGVELSEHNMSKCDRTVRAIVDEVQRDDESVVVTPALQTYLRKYAVLTEQMRVWHAQQAMEKDSMQESSRTVREQAKALAKDQERKIVQLMEEKDMLDKRLRLMEQQSRSSISDFALQTGNTQELKSRIQDLEHQVEDLENELRLSKAAFTELEESVQGTSDEIKSLQKQLAKAGAEKNIEMQKLKQAHQAELLEREREKQEREMELAAQIAALTKQCDHLRETLESVRQEVKRLEGELQQVHESYAAKIQGLEHQNRTMELRIADLTGALETARENEAKAVKTVRALEAKVAEFDRVKEQLAKSEGLLAKVKLDLQEAKAGSAAVEAQLASANDRALALEKAAEDLKAKHAQELAAAAAKAHEQLVALEKEAEEKVAQAGGKAEAQIRQMKETLDADLHDLEGDFTTIGAFASEFVDFANRALDSEEGILDAIPDELTAGQQPYFNETAVSSASPDDDNVHIRQKVLGHFSSKAAKHVRGIFDLAHRIAGMAASGDLGGGALSALVEDLEEQLRKKSAEMESMQALLVKYGIVDEDGNINENGVMASDVREAAAILEGAEKLYSGEVQGDDVDPVHTALVQRAETFVESQRMSTLGDVAQRAFILVTKFKTWRVAADAAREARAHNKEQASQSVGESETKPMLDIGKTKMNEAGFNSRGSSRQSTARRTQSFHNESSTPIVEQGEAMGLPSLLPRTPRSALITPRSARGTPRSTTTTPRDPRDDPATQLRRSLKASRSSAAVLSGDTGERGDGSGTIRPRAQSAGATHLGALADLRPPPNRRGVLGGGSVGDGAPGGGGGAYDMNLTPRSPRELSPDGSRASTARSRNRVGSAGSVVGGDTIFPDAVEVTQVDADELELNLEDTGRGRAGSDLADDAIGPHASFRRRSDSAVDAPANEVARRTRPSTVGHKAVRPPLGKPLRRGGPGSNPNLVRAPSKLSVFDFNDADQLPPFSMRSTALHTEMNAVNTIEAGKLKHHITRLEQELKAMKKANRQLSQQVSAAQARARRGASRDGGKGAFLFAPGSSLRGGSSFGGRKGLLESCEEWILRDKKYLQSCAELQDKVAKARQTATQTKSQLKGGGVRREEEIQALKFRFHEEKELLAAFEKKLADAQQRRTKNQERIMELFERISEAGNQLLFINMSTNLRSRIQERVRKHNEETGGPAVEDDEQYVSNNNEHGQRHKFLPRHTKPAGRGQRGKHGGALRIDVVNPQRDEQRAVSPADDPIVFSRPPAY